MYFYINYNILVLKVARLRIFIVFILGYIAFCQESLLECPHYK
jgi:hypothetical protein